MGAYRPRVAGLEPCPLGRHLNADGTLTWMGLEWEGPPIFHRWLVRRKVVQGPDRLRIAGDRPSGVRVLRR